MDQFEIKLPTSFAYCFSNVTSLRYDEMAVKLNQGANRWCQAHQYKDYEWEKNIIKYKDGSNAKERQMKRKGALREYERDGKHECEFNELMCTQF